MSEYKTHLNKSLWIALFCCFPSLGISQEKSMTSLARELTSVEGVSYEFNHDSRFTFRRTPGKRAGVSFGELSSYDKDVLHQMLLKSLGSLGYHKIMLMVFNEDLPKQAEPILGHEQYWVAVYGTPVFDRKWQLRVEGHHLSLNLTFMGEELVSSSPFLFGSWPAKVNASDHRRGFQNLYWEEEIGKSLIESLGESGYHGADIPNPLPGESVEITDLKSGVQFQDLEEDLQMQVRHLINEYLSYFNHEYVLGLDFFEVQKTHVHWWGDINGRYSYIIESEALRVEFQNLGNHIHCLIRIPSHEEW